MNLNQPLERLVAYCRETAVLRSIEALLHWDERTGLPSQAGDYRAEQTAYLAGRIHERATSTEFGDLLAAAADSSQVKDADPHSDQATTVRKLQWEFKRQERLPLRLVEEISRQTVHGQQSWGAARQDNDFESFQPTLEKIVRLKKEQAEAYGYEDHLYDALLEDYEPGEKTARLTDVLYDLRDRLVPLVEAIAAGDKSPDAGILKRNYPVDGQQDLGKKAASQIGYDYDRGRLDETTHPFCTELGPHDVRILTRYNPHFFNESFFGTLHEAGHGIYEQGLRKDWYGLPPGTYLSLGIHESQSRLWENLVGRSRAFWQHFYPTAQATFPAALNEVSLDQFYAAVNDVRPSLIRVEADEVTYNLHIVIRFELEQAILSGDLSIADLPAAWNEKYQALLGIQPPSDQLGVLQDVHWAAGLFGYFATYSLGNLYAAQMFAAAERDLGDLNEMFAAGEFSPLHGWLKTHVYEKGQCYSAAELIKKLSGRELTAEPLIDYLNAKLKPIYGLD